MGKSFEALAKDTKKFFALSGKKKAVLGVSGGVDSALTCAIAAKALGGKNVFCLHLPYYSDPTAKAHAETAARLFGAHFKVVSIRRMVDGIAGELKCDREGKGNVMARVRMVVLYDFARKENALVAGTGNKSELSLGYFSKYGDGGVDFLPIGGLLGYVAVVTRQEILLLFVGGLFVVEALSVILQVGMFKLTGRAKNGAAGGNTTGVGFTACDRRIVAGADRRRRNANALLPIGRNTGTARTQPRRESQGKIRGGASEAGRGHDESLAAQEAPARNILILLKVL